MSKQLAPFHFDIVGSFLRPAELKEAREAFTKGNITKEELTAVEDCLITDLIQNGMVLIVWTYIILLILNGITDRFDRFIITKSEHI